MAGSLSWSSLPSCLQKNWKCIQLKLPLSCEKTATGSSHINYLGDFSHPQTSSTESSPSTSNSPLSGLHTFQCNDFTRRVHDSTVSWNWSSDWVAGVIHVNDHHLSLFSYFLSDADKFVRLHCQSAEPNVCWVDAQILELEEKKKFNIKLLLWCSHEQLLWISQEISDFALFFVTKQPCHPKPARHTELHNFNWAQQASWRSPAAFKHLLSCLQGPFTT